MVAPRFPLMSDKATFTIEMSISSIIAAEIVVITIMARANPVGNEADGADDMLLHFYFHVYAQTCLKDALVFCIIIQFYFYGDTLGDLHKISSGIIRRQQRKFRAGCQTERSNFSFDVN